MRIPETARRSGGGTIAGPDIRPSGGCALPRRLACGVITTAAGTACALTAGTACRPALEAVRDVGCCDCLNSRTLRRLCHEV